MHERSENVQNEIVVHWLDDDIELFLRVEFACFSSSHQIFSDLVCAASSPTNWNMKQKLLWKQNGSNWLTCANRTAKIWYAKSNVWAQPNEQYRLRSKFNRCICIPDRNADKVAVRCTTCVKWKVLHEEIQCVFFFFHSIPTSRLPLFGFFSSVDTATYSSRHLPPNLIPKLDDCRREMGKNWWAIVLVWNRSRTHAGGI